MKKVVKVMLPLLFAATSLAQFSSLIVWHRIVGVITAPGTSNTVAGFNSGGPWTASGGNVMIDMRVNPQTFGTITFVVEGLVLVGGNASGTPGPVTSVRGTLVCEPGSPTQTIVDTPLVPLSSQGNAAFIGRMLLHEECINPLFLIRTDSGAWIATGAVREFF